MDTISAVLQPFKLPLGVFSVIADAPPASRSVFHVAAIWRSRSQPGFVSAFITTIAPIAVFLAKFAILCSGDHTMGRMIYHYICGFLCISAYRYRRLADYYTVLCGIGVALVIASPAYISEWQHDSDYTSTFDWWFFGLNVLLLVGPFVGVVSVRPTGNVFANVSQCSALS